MEQALLSAVSAGVLGFLGRVAWRIGGCLGVSAAVLWAAWALSAWYAVAFALRALGL